MAIGHDEKRSNAVRRVRSGVLVRERILARLREAARYRVVLLIAGAGYGKSEALAQYLRPLRRPKVVVRIPKGANTLASFLQSIADGLHAVAPGMSMSVTSACSASSQVENPARALAIWARTHLAEFRGIIAIEDFENADSSSTSVVGDFLHHLIREHQGIQWFISSRHGGVLPIAEWIAAGIAGVPLSAMDLRFTEGEVLALATLVVSSLSDEAIHAMTDRLDGWPFAIIYELRSSTEPHVPEFMSGHVVISQYLVAEVWGRLAPEERAFLEFAAVLRDFTMARAIRAGFDEAARIGSGLRERLAFASFRGGVFTIHALFRTFVLEQIALKGNAFLVSLHKKCADLLVADGEAGAALECLLDTGSHTALSEFIRGRELPLTDVRYREAVRRVVAALRGLNCQSASFLAAICAFDDGNYREVVRHGKDLIDEGSLPDKLYMPFLAILARATLNCESFESIKRNSWLATAQNSASVKSLRSSMLAFSAAMETKYSEAERYFEESKASITSLESSLRPVILHLLAGTATWLRRHDEAIRYSKEALNTAIALGGEGLAASCAANVMSSQANCEWDPRSLRESMSHVRYFCERNGLWHVLRHVLEGYALKLAYAGLVDEAENALAELASLPRPIRQSDWSICVKLVEAAILIMRVDLVAARQNLPHAINDSKRRSEGIARDQAADGYLLLSFCEAILGDREAAVKALEQYRKIEIPYDIPALFARHLEIVVLLALDRATEARRLLRLVRGRHAAAEPAERWYTVVLSDPKAPQLGAELSRVQEHPGLGLIAKMLDILLESRREDPASVTLTPAERHVLEMLAQDLGNKEIAHARACAEATVKVHVRSIMRKLGARSRRAAVSLAQQRSIIGARLF